VVLSKLDLAAAMMKVKRIQGAI